MNTDILAGQWKQLKGTAKTQWAKLTDDDLMHAEGDYDKLVGSIQKRYGYARGRAEEEVNAWLETSPLSGTDWQEAR
ncbi:MAG: CsbD family protein [Vicinamibacterales bacterium]